MGPDDTMTQLLSHDQVPTAPAPPDPRRSLTQLIVVVVAGVLLAVVTNSVDLLIVIAAIGIMIMVHELGHFATAKWSHMKVTEYFLGFGPRLWSFRRGETEYGVKALPLGGYVKIVGMSNLEEVDPEDEPRTYRQQPFHNRLLVAVAGSTMHFVMAILLIFVILVAYGLPDIHEVQVAALSSWPGRTTPAAQVHLEAGDVIVSADGHPVNGFSQMETLVGTHVGVPVTLVVRQAGHDRTVTVVPVDGRHVIVDGAPVLAAHDRHPGLIGVEIQNPGVRVDPIAAAGQSLAGPIGFGPQISASFAGIGKIFSLSGIQSFFHDVTSAKAAEQSARTGDRPQSIVGAVRTATQASEAGTPELLEVLIELNIFIGIINLFPMLPLDGGHVVIALYERIRSRRGRRYHADVRKLAPAAYTVVGLLAVLVLSTLYLDITHPIVNPFK